MKKYKVNDIASLAANSSTIFECSNNDVKKEYIRNNINKVVECMKLVPGFKGAFGTGYPYYAIGSNMKYSYPIIEEQIRYNNELVNAAKKSEFSEWHCAECLKTTGQNMPDLKKICNNCDKVDSELRPRKIINRLPDLDLWFICDDGLIDTSKEFLKYILERNNIFPSDIAVVETIENVREISQAISEDKIPNKYLPLDIHIIGLDEMIRLVERIPLQIMKYLDGIDKAYLAIWPESLRKTWARDDMPYNFIFDFLFSFTPIEIEGELKERILTTRNTLASMLEPEKFEELLAEISPPSVKRRFENPQLKRVYSERYKNWRSKK